MNRSHLTKSLLLLVAAVGFGHLSAIAQDPLLERARLLQQLEISKAESDTANALREAEQLARTSPIQGVKILKAQIYSLDKSVNLPSEKRAALVKQLEVKLAQLEGKPAPQANANKKLSQEEVKKIQEEAKKEADEVKSGIQEVANLYDQNKFAEAQKKITELTSKFPNNPAMIALQGQGYVGDRVAAARELSRQQAERVLLALTDVDRSALPPKGDIEFPAGWAEKMERRDKLNSVQLDADTQLILERLELPVKPGQGIRSGSFESAISTLSTIMQKDIFMNTDDLRDAGVDLNKPVSMPDDVSVRTALRAVLQANGLTFIIKDKSIIVVSRDQARKMLVKRAYYIGDVLSSPLGGGATFGPLVDYSIAMQNAQLIIDAIKKSIDPLGWSGQGGDSSIMFHAPSLSIIVSAPAEVHYMVDRATKPRRP